MKLHQRAKARAVIDDAPDEVHACAGQDVGDPSTGERELVWGEYLKGVASGNELALKTLFEEAHSLVFAIALRIISFPSDAEEIVCEATLLSSCINENPDVAIDLARTESSLKRAPTLPSEQRRAIELFYFFRPVGGGADCRATEASRRHGEDAAANGAVETAASIRGGLSVSGNNCTTPVCRH